jgi:hypothetical protein
MLRMSNPQFADRRRTVGRGRVAMIRFGAKLLFVFEVSGNAAKQFRICEERIIVVMAKTPTAAYSKAMGKGKKAQTQYHNHQGELVSVQFIGIMDLLKLDPVLSDDEVWYEIKELHVRTIGSGRLIPKYDDLTAVAEWGK